MARHAAKQRQEAAALFAAGERRAEVARRLGVSRATTTRWYRRWRLGGEAALIGERRAGRRPKLTPRELVALQRALARRPRDFGYDLDEWTLASITAFVAATTGVRYHARHIPRLLRRLGWVVPPVGPAAVHAFRQCEAVGPDGQSLLIRVRRFNGA